MPHKVTLREWPSTLSFIKSAGQVLLHSDSIYVMNEVSQPILTIRRSQLEKHRSISSNGIVMSNEVAKSSYRYNFESKAFESIPYRPVSSYYVEYQHYIYNMATTSYYNGPLARYNLKTQHLLEIPSTFCSLCVIGEQLIYRVPAKNTIICRDLDTLDMHYHIKLDPSFDNFFLVTMDIKSVFIAALMAC